MVATDSGRPILRLSVAVSTQILAGFFLAGCLMGLVGPLLPVWGYLKLDYVVAGQYFLALAAGVWLGGISATGLRERHTLLVLWRVAGVLSTALILLISLFTPPVPPSYRQCGLFLLGGAAGLLQALLWERLEILYRHNGAASMQLAGLAFAAGGLVPPLAVAIGYLLEGEANVLYVLAALPLSVTLLAGRQIPEAAPLIAPDPPLWRTPSLFLVRTIAWLQTGSEWCIAGWLAIFMIKRIGVNPSTALLTTVLYGLLLMVGRVGAHALMRRSRRALLLPGSLAATFFGCVFLTSTNNLTGAILGLLLICAGFAPVLPLAGEKLNGQLPDYPLQAALRSSRAITAGSLIVPGVFGYIASVVEIRAMLLLPLFGSIAVFTLLLLLSLESKLQEMKRIKATAG